MKILYRIKGLAIFLALCTAGCTPTNTKSEPVRESPPPIPAPTKPDKTDENSDDKILQDTAKNFDFLTTDVYPFYAPNSNKASLATYIKSAEFTNHKDSALAYFNNSKMNQDDARIVLENRDPVNIAMNTNYNAAALQELLSRLHTQKFLKADIIVDQKLHHGHLRNSAYSRDLPLSSNPAQGFASKPYTVAIYSETFLWPNHNGIDQNKKELAVLSLPAPALDVFLQPHYPYYVQNNLLNQTRYKQEMIHLAKTIVKAAVDHQKTAFSGKGLNRLILSRYGQENFLSALLPSQKTIAQQIFTQSLIQEITTAKNNGSLTIPVYLSMLSANAPFAQNFIAAGIEPLVGDIRTVTQDRDLIVNAWDPHSLPGNGNDKDNSLDGYVGRSTAILLSQSPYFNERLKYVGVY